MPLLIGGSGEKVTLRIVAEHADMWHGFGDVRRYKAKSEVLAGHCAAVGRDPDSVTRVWAVPGGKLETAEALQAAGVGVLTTSVSGPDYDLGAVRELLQWRDG